MLKKREIPFVLIEDSLFKAEKHIPWEMKQHADNGCDAEAAGENYIDLTTESRTVCNKSISMSDLAAIM